jgi:putative tryptophan/tyrosine transport system substrate-binding protein
LLKFTPKKIVHVLFASLLLMALTSCGNDSSDRSAESEKAPEIKVGIVYTEPHPVLTTIAEAFKAELRARIPGVVFVERHGSGSKAQYPATVRSVLAEGVALIAPITTPMSVEALRQAGNSVPVVFLAVTDPLGAELITSFENPEKCSGVSDNPPMAGVIDLVLEFLPNAKTIGIPYDPRDQPGVTTAHRTADLARARSMKAILKPVANENELRSAVRSLAAETDAIVIGMDNLMMKNAGIISRTAMDQGKALFAADDKSIEMGAVAGVGIDYADVGRLGGEIAIRVLVGDEMVGEIPAKALDSGQIFYNSKSCNQLGLAIPTEIVSTGKAMTIVD